MVTIKTKVLNPTNTKPSRVKATLWGASRVLEWDHGLNSFENHKRAALAIAKACGEDATSGEYVAGDIPLGYVFVKLSDYRMTV